MSRRVSSALFAILVMAPAIATFSPSVAFAGSANMKTRVDLLFRLGFAGKWTGLDLPGVVPPGADADNSPGASLRVDIPIFRYMTLGPLLSAYAVRADFPGLDYNPVVDISPFVKGRYPFWAGKKKAEVYGLFQAGFTMAFLRGSTRASDRFGPGWNIGLSPGFQILLGPRFGLLTELGWLRTQGNFTDGNLVINQGVWRVGFVF